MPLTKCSRYPKKAGRLNSQNVVINCKQYRLRTLPPISYYKKTIKTAHFNLSKITLFIFHHSMLVTWSRQNNGRLQVWFTAYLKDIRIKENNCPPEETETVLPVPPFSSSLLGHFVCLKNGKKQACNLFKNSLITGCNINHKFSMDFSRLWLIFKTLK